MSENDDNNSFSIDFEQIEQVSKVFFEESKEILDELDDLILGLESAPHDAALLNNLFRRVHTLKGSVGPVPGGQLLGSLAHEFEALLSKLKKEKKAVTAECTDLFLQSSKLLKLLAQGLREQQEIYPEVLSEVIELISRYGHFELPEEETGAPPPPARHPPKRESVVSDEGVWLTQSQFEEMMRVSGELLTLKNHFQMMAQTGDFQSRQSEFAQGLNKVSDTFHVQLEKVLKVRAEESLKGLSALVRQASTELNKEILFTTAGMDLWIDRGLGRDLNEALIHLIRNSVDHGIEDPFDRATQGKSSVGQLHLELSEKNGFVVVDFRDDGQGLQRERILRKAIEKGLVPAAEGAALPDQKVFEFIFHPGFSTKEKITTISGRGVGMDVVSSLVQKYRGQIDIESKPGQGARFVMRFALPQHLMMESVILCEWRALQIAVPLESVVQIQSVSELQLTQMENFRYCQWNSLTVPLLNYQEIRDRRVSESPAAAMSAIFIRHAGAVLGFLSDRIIGQSDIMVRPFRHIVRRVDGFRGTTILADDRVTYVMDPEKIFALLEHEKLPTIAKEAA